MFFKDCSADQEEAEESSRNPRYITIVHLREFCVVTNHRADTR